MKRTIQMFFIFLFAGNCAMSSSKKIYPLSNGSVTVVGNKIYHDGKPFAELRFLATNLKYNTHRGLAIYYYDYIKEMWIYPNEGLRIYGGKEYYTIKEIEDEWDKHAQSLSIGNKKFGKTEVVSGWCYDVQISEDGKYVYYKAKGIFFHSSHKYLVEYGLSK